MGGGIFQMRLLAVGLRSIFIKMMMEHFFQDQRKCLEKIYKNEKENSDIYFMHNYEKYIPFIIYAYDGKTVKWLCICEEYIMRIYEGGIIEYITGGVQTHFFYDKVEKDSVITLRLADIVIDSQDEDDFHYYKEVEKVQMISNLY